ncbi:MAG: hypothetical protein ACPG4Q_11020 [Phycisphaeraceae bacterium]
MTETNQPEQAVSARDVLLAIHEYLRLGHTRVIENLEQREPDLAEHLMEGLSQIHRDLLNAGLDARHTRKLYRSVEALALVCVRALETAHSS